MDIESMKSDIVSVAVKYHVKSIILFGSRADGTYNEDSDVDLIIEFHRRVSLLTLAEIQIELETLFNKKVDVIHGPVKDDDLIEIGKTVELYAA